MDASSYSHPIAKPDHTHAYLLPAVRAALEGSSRTRKIFELGCGNGSMASVLTTEGWKVIGVDPSRQGIANANAAFPHLELSVGSAYDDLASLYGQFPIVMSLEVVEHLYDPRAFARALAALLEPGGLAIVSTPYHGYWKNLALALTGKMDQHFTALWDNGHIKFWSVKTLTALLAEVGLKVGTVYRVGRLPALAKSMVLVARKA